MRLVYGTCQSMLRFIAAIQPVCIFDMWVFIPFPTASGAPITDRPHNGHSYRIRSSRDTVKTDCSGVDIPAFPALMQAIAAFVADLSIAVTLSSILHRQKTGLPRCVRSLRYGPLSVVALTSHLNQDRFNRD